MKSRLLVILGLAAFFSVAVGNLFVAGQSLSPAPVAAQTAKPQAAAPAADAGWPDRRPIGVVFLSEGGHSFREPGFRTAHNPRGWNPAFHRNSVTGVELDVADPIYAEKFDAAVDAFVLQSLDRAQKFNCQGVLFWDLEGSEFDHPTTYVGSGGLYLPPEMRRDRVKAWVDALKARNMWAGFTFRDTAFVSTPYGPDQANGADPAEALMWKMQKCRFVYGDNCRSAYLDSFVDAESWTDGKVHPRPAAVLEKIQSKIPGWLVIPEYGGEGYDKVPRVAPLRYWGAPSVQPFEVLQPTDAKISTLQRTEYVRAMRAGALTLITVTWASPQTAWVPNAWRAGQGH